MTKYQLPDGNIIVADAGFVAAHHLHGATLQDGPRLWTVAAFGGEVSLCATAGGVSAGQLMSPCVARAIVIELGRALRALGEQQRE